MSAAATEARGSKITYIGLFIALFAMVIARQLVAYFSPTLMIGHFLIDFVANVLPQLFS